jgi:hypothetical protein
MLMTMIVTLGVEVKGLGPRVRYDNQIVTETHEAAIRSEKSVGMYLFHFCSSGVAKTAFSPVTEEDWLEVQVETGSEDVATRK